MKKKLIITVSFVLLFLLVMTLILRVSGPFIKSRLVSLAEKQLNLQLEIDEFGLSLTGGIQAEGIRLRDKESQTTVSASALRSRISPVELLRKNLSFYSLTIEDLTLDDNFFSVLEDMPGKNKKESSPWNISVNNLRLKNSAFFYGSRKTGIDIENGYFSFTGGENFSLSLEQTLVSQNKSALEVKLLRASGVTDDEKLELESLFISLAGFEIYGGLQAAKAPPLDIKGTFKAEGQTEKILALAGSFLDYDIPPAGSYLSARVDIEGTMDSPEMHLESSMENFFMGNFNFPAAELRGSFKDETIILDNVHISGKTGGGAELQGRYFLRDRLLDFKAQLENFPLGDVLHFPAMEEDLTGGIIDAGMTFTGPVEEFRKWRSRAEFTLSGASYQNRKIKRIRGDLNVHEGSAVANLKAKESQIRLEGNYTQNRFKGTFTADITEIETFLLHAQIENLSGSIKTEGNFSTDMKEFNALAEIESARLTYEHIPISLRGGEVLLENGKLSFRDIRAKGNFTLQQKSILREKLPRLKGALEYSISLRGTPEDPHASFSVHITSPSFEDYSADRLYISGLYRREEPRIDSFFVQKSTLVLFSPSSFGPLAESGEIALNIYQIPPALVSIAAKDLEEKLHKELSRSGESKLTFDLSRPREASVKFMGEDLRLEMLRDFFELPVSLKGEAQVEAEFRGNLKNPNLELELLLGEVSIEELHISGATFRARMKENIITLESFEIRTAGYGRAQGNFSFKALDPGNLLFRPDPGHDSRGSIMLKEIDFRILNPFLEKTTLSAGLLSADMNWSGKPGNPSVRGEVKIDGLSLATADGRRFEDLNLAASLRERTVQIESLSAPVGEKLLELRGAFTYLSPGSYEWDLVLKADQKDRIFSSGKIERDSISAANKITEFSLSGISDYLPWIKDPSGVINADIDLGGTLKNPQVFGTLSVERFGLDIDPLQERLKGEELVADFHRREIVVRSFKARTREGTLSARGKITHKDLQPEEMNINASLTDLRVKSPGTGRGLIRRADLSARGQKNEFLLSGSLELGEFFITAEDTPARSPEINASPAPGENFALDLTLRSGDKLWVYNRAGRIRLKGNLKLSGTAGAPLVTGRLLAREGYVMYLDRKFTLTEGYVDFDGKAENVPYVDISARTRVRSLRQEEDVPYDISLRAYGRADDIHIDLSSQPVLDSSDIISLLTFGATRSQLTESERLLSLRAEELASMRLTGYISAYAGNILNLDVIAIEGNVFRAGSAHGPRVRAQKNLSENIALAYVGNLGPQDSAIVASRTTGRTEIIYTEGIGRSDEQKLQMRYSLTPSLSAEALTDHTGRSNIGLKYSIWIR